MITSPITAFRNLIPILRLVLNLSYSSHLIECSLCCDALTSDKFTSLLTPPSTAKSNIRPHIEITLSLIRLVSYSSLYNSHMIKCSLCCCGALTSRKFTSHITPVLLINLVPLPSPSQCDPFSTIFHIQLSSLPPSQCSMRTMMLLPRPCVYGQMPSIWLLERKSMLNLSLCCLFILNNIYIALQPTHWFPMVVTLVAQSTHLPTSKH